MEAITGPAPDCALRRSHLPRPGLQRVVGLALLDPAFSHRLLNGSRAAVLADTELGLSADEQKSLMTIRADTLADFAAAIAAAYPS